MLQRLIHNIILFLLLVNVSMGATYYVTTNGTGNGSSWTNASSDFVGLWQNLQQYDTLIFSNGTYNITNTTLLFSWDHVIIKSVSNNPADVILDGSNYNCEIHNFQNILSGLTIKNFGYVNDSYFSVPINGGVISNCIITKCRSRPFYSGGLIVNASVYNTIITSNTVPNNAQLNSSCPLYSCLVYDNTSLGSGSCAPTYSSCYNTTIVNNTGNTAVVNCYLYNCISWGNSSTDRFSVGYFATNSCGRGIYYTTNSCTTNNPMFISTNNFRLQVSSPCIDKGTDTIRDLLPPMDLDNNKRIWQRAGTVDMGAYEYGSPSYTGDDTIHMYGTNINKIIGNDLLHIIRRN